ncbi:MAG: HlyC/CorC family transporter [Gemmatimonadetes bacterium]|nr:HlyC/CorC family transporter [Gemmatimonadota bacterium]
MIGWLLMLGGVLLSSAGTTIAAASAAVSRLELARWISGRLRGAAVASALLSTPGRVLGMATGVATAGLVLGSMGVAAVLASMPPVVSASVVVLVAVPLLIALTYSLPRAVGRRWPDRLVRRGAPAMEWLSRMAAPLLLVGGPDRDVSRVVRAGEREGALGDEELTLFSGVVAFAARSVREVMTPRTEILAVPESASVVDVARLIGESGYSRLPVYRESLDHIVGAVHAFDLLKAAPGDPLPLRPVSVVPASKKCADLFSEMQRDDRQIAVVLDEFGGTAGIVTQGDLLKELTAEIFDDGQGRPETAGQELVEVDGTTTMSELAARFGVVLPTADGSVGGFLARGAGRIPLAGERFSAAGLEFDVLSATPVRVERVAVRRGPVNVQGLGTGGGR